MKISNCITVSFAFLIGIGPASGFTWSMMAPVGRATLEAIADGKFIDQRENAVEDGSTPPEGAYFEAILRPAEGAGIEGSVQVEKKNAELAMELEIQGLDPGAEVEIAFHNPAEIFDSDQSVAALVGTPLAVHFPARDLKADEQGQIQATAVIDDPESIEELVGKIVALHSASGSPQPGRDIPAPMSDPLAYGTIQEKSEN